MDPVYSDPLGRIRRLFRRPVSPEAVLISFICLLDLVTTLYWVSRGHAREGNPALAYYLELGTFPFVLAKLFTFVPALMAAEWYRPRNPPLIARVMRWAIVGYLVLYVAGVAGHHGRVMEFYRCLFF